MGREIDVGHLLKLIALSVKHGHVEEGSKSHNLMLAQATSLDADGRKTLLGTLEKHHEGSRAQLADVWAHSGSRSVVIIKCPAVATKDPKAVHSLIEKARKADTEGEPADDGAAVDGDDEPKRRPTPTRILKCSVGSNLEGEGTVDTHVRVKVPVRTFDEGEESVRYNDHDILVRIVWPTGKVPFMEVHASAQHGKSAAFCVLRAICGTKVSRRQGKATAGIYEFLSVDQGKVRGIEKATGLAWVGFYGPNKDGGWDLHAVSNNKSPKDDAKRSTPLDLTLPKVKKHYEALNKVRTYNYDFTHVAPVTFVEKLVVSLHFEGIFHIAVPSRTSRAAVDHLISAIYATLI